MSAIPDHFFSILFVFVDILLLYTAYGAYRQYRRNGLPKFWASIISQDTRTPNQYDVRKPELILKIMDVQIRAWVGKDDLLRASMLLLELIEFCYQQRRNEALLLKANIYDIEKKEHTGTLPYEQIRRERNRLGLAILDLLDRICE